MKSPFRTKRFIGSLICVLTLIFGISAVGALSAQKAWADTPTTVTITYYAGKIGDHFENGESTRVQDKVAGEPVEISDVLPVGTATGPAHPVKLETCGGVLPEGQSEYVRQSYVVNNTFASWNTKEDGSGDTYQVGQKYEGDEPLELWAQYSTENINDSENLPAVTRDGYTFDGWYTAETDGDKIGNAGEQLNSSIWIDVIYAHWTQVPETVQPATEQSAAAAQPAVQQTQEKIVPTGDDLPIGVALIAVIAAAISVGVGIKRRH